MAKKEIDIEDILGKYSANLNIPKTTTECISLDNLLGGGLADGYMYSIWGTSGGGKSTITCQICRVRCEMGQRVIYIDIEKALNDVQIESFGLTPYVENGQFKVLTAFNFAEVSELCCAIAKAKAADLVVIDSWSELMALEDPEALDVTSNQPGVEARQGGKVLKQIKSLFYQAKIPSILIFQARANLMKSNPYDDNDIMQGGYAAYHVPDARIKVSVGAKIKNDDGDILGQELTIVCQKNKFGLPFKKRKVKFFFGRGVNRVMEIIDLAIELGIITGSGAFYTLPNGDRVQGTKKLYAIDNEDLLLDLRQQVLKALETEISND